VKVSTRATLAVDIDTAWEMLHTPAVFRLVSAPFTVFREKPESPLPDRFQPDTDYEVDVWAGGLVSLGQQIIHLVDDIESWAKRTTTDTGRGVSGVLSATRNWNHRMSLEALPDGTTLFHDRLSVSAGWLTPVMWLGLGVFWQWRALRLRSIARASVSSSQKAWNLRYLNKSSLWSGEVNPTLLDAASSLPPGRALDVGAGEGGDALWLAENRWQVTALDASAVAVFRGASEAEKRKTTAGDPLDIRWLVADVESSWPAKGLWDLVTIHFLHLPQTVRKKVWSQAIERVAPGGTLLIVGHSVRDLTTGLRRPAADLLFTTDEWEAVTPPDWTTWSVAEVPREIIRNGESVTVWDVVLVGVR